MISAGDSLAGKLLMASRNSRKLWSVRLSGGGTGVARPQPAEVRVWRGEPFAGCVLGIDPSLRGTGLAVLERRGDGRIACLDSRTLRLGRSVSLVDCLAEIARTVGDLLERFPVRHVAAEGTIYVQNFQTAQAMGASRGAALAMAGLRGRPVFEYAPLRVKQAVVGFGRASKEQVGRTVQQLLGLESLLPVDESDAAAVALCHMLTWREEVASGNKVPRESLP